MGYGDGAGLARAISPDARFRHRGLRSLEANFASPSWLRSISSAARWARARPPTRKTLRRTRTRREKEIPADDTTRRTNRYTTPSVGCYEAGEMTVKVPAVRIPRLDRRPGAAEVSTGCG